VSAYTWAFILVGAAALLFWKLYTGRLSEEEALAVREALAAGAKLVDVRTPAEFSAGHVPGAVNIPLSELGRRHRELRPRSGPVVVYCRSGSRSAGAAGLLRAKGFKHVLDMKGIGNWERVEVPASP